MLKEEDKGEGVKSWTGRWFGRRLEKEVVGVEREKKSRRGERRRGLLGKFWGGFGWSRRLATKAA